MRAGSWTECGPGKPRGREAGRHVVIRARGVEHRHRGGGVRNTFHVPEKVSTEVPREQGKKAAELTDENSRLILRNRFTAPWRVPWESSYRATEKKDWSDSESRPAPLARCRRATFS